jgi:ABC-type Mn2+/Zn2+ transport system ATPase subunit
MAQKLKWERESGRGVTVKELLNKPEIVVFAGPNGSGKSTFTELLKPPIKLMFDFPGNL